MNNKPTSSMQVVITNTENNQRNSINNWLRNNIPEESKEFVEGIDDLIDFTNILHTNLTKIGFTKVILMPKRNVFTNDITYEPYFAAVALARQLGYSRPDDVCRRVLKNHCIKSITELQLPANCREQIIVPESLNIKEIGQMKFTDFNGAKYLITHVAHSGDERFGKYKQLASKILGVMNAIKNINDMIINTLNKKMPNYIAKLNQGITPTTEEIEAMKVMTKTTGTNNVIAKSKDELCKEQDDMMREWVMSKMPPKLLPYFKDVKNAWDRTEVVTSCLRGLNYKDIILKPVNDEFSNEMKYEPYFRLNTLASELGYTKPADLFKPNGPLYMHMKYTMDNIICKLRSYTEAWDTIIPSHLDDKTDRNRNNYIYIDISACEDLISAAMKQSKFREKAREFKDVLNTSTKVSNAIITKLNQLVAEYRQQQQAQQLISLEEAKKKQDQQLAAIEADKQKMDEQKKRLEEETKLLALKKFPDIIVEKSHYGYIFSSPDYMAHNLYKIGITDNLTNRERDAKTYNPDGSFLHTVESYDSRSTELTMHIALKKYGLWHEISAGNEWFYVPSLEEAKKLLDIATNNTAMLYDHIASYASTLRNGFSIDIKQLPTQRLAIMDAPSIESLITDYVNEVVKHIIDSNTTSMSKTNMIQLLRKVAHGPKYRKKKDQLPTDLDTFLANSITGTHGINMSKKQTKSTVTIKIEIAMIGDTNANANTAMT